MRRAKKLVARTKGSTTTISDNDSCQLNQTIAVV